MRLKPKNESDPLERCYTQAKEANIMASYAERLARVNNPVVLDPSVGGGSLLLGIQRKMPHSYRIGIDLDPDAAAEGANIAIRAESFLDWSPVPGHEPDLIVANPPFSLAREFIEKSLIDVKPGGGLIFLLPIGFLATKKRRDLFGEKAPSTVVILSERPRFDDGSGRNGWKKSATDGKEYMIAIWDGRRTNMGTDLVWR